ncbi:MAG TPA: hypothetical protein VF812_17610 [Ktedonobacterales bacterium]
MAHLRQSGASSGVRKAPRSLWERAGAQAGNGAGALFARLDAQSALPDESVAHVSAVSEARAQGALTLERVAAEIRAGAWNTALAALVADATDALATLPDGRAAETRGG